MTHLNWRSLILGALLASVVECAQAQTQYCVTSDPNANTACGTDALHSNTTSLANTALGAYTLYTNTTGEANTALGAYTLFYNTTGSNNSASGYNALKSNTTGSYNSASGLNALESNTIGNDNTASGFAALESNTTGNDNSASGWAALASNTTGSSNTASGFQALYSNISGIYNTASGVGGLYSNTVGDYNTASGYQALRANSSGNNNVAVGYQAGIKVTTGSNNIDIGNKGAATDGAATDSGVIRIGTQTPTALQSKTYIAGIYDNTSVSGIGVVIDSNGQLGTVSSSERFKADIEPMGSNTSKLQRLRPVTFHYKADPQGTLRYGLIAEQVAKVYPELVVRDSKGRIDGVRYDELGPMLLNEMQKLQQTNSSQAAEIRELKGQVAALNELKQEMRAALVTLQSKDQLVAQR